MSAFVGVQCVERISSMYCGDITIIVEHPNALCGLFCSTESPKVSFLVNPRRFSICSKLAIE